MEDFWPTISETDADAAALSLLKEQARLLSQKTGGKLQAELYTFPVGGSLQHNFEIVVPALGGYRFQLFSVSHTPEGFPIHAQVEDKHSTLKTESSFEEWLRATLSSERTRKILANLLSQVNAQAA
ncbi:MAG TPA: hypothetical protein PKJ41_15680 [Bryobacteraceae bacterium]|nr:hypothetical protein [Bryobacteraceae bacterium]HPT29308.1 hypothetical protein [Bryobacteraceae bacterium]